LFFAPSLFHGVITAGCGKIRIRAKVVKPARFMQTLPLCDGAMVNGKKVSATIDTGSDGTFKLTPAAVDSLGLTEAARNGTPNASVGYKGITQNTLGRIEEIVIGDIRLHFGGSRLFRQRHRPRSQALGREYRERLPARLHRDRGLSAQADHASAAVSYRTRAAAG